MLLTELERSFSILDRFDDLSGYEKGAVARALLKLMVKQGNLVSFPRDDALGMICISVEEWQLKLLARFSADCEDECEPDDREILLETLIQLR